MKKKIIVITTTALMLGGTFGYAAANSPLIGAKVQGLFTVQKVDGTKIGDAALLMVQHTRQCALFRKLPVRS